MSANWIRQPVVAASVALSLIHMSAAHAASQAPVAAENGMVVTAQQLATRVGVDVLKDGGNAVDAAVAVGYALAVVYPAAGNLGGGGFMTIQLADGRKTFIDFRETAPRASTPNMYLDKEGNVIKGASTRGHLAAGVPGTVSGLELALQRYGTMKRNALLTPAIRYAREGFVLDQGDVDMLATATEDFRKDAASASIFLNAGQPFASGQRLVQKDLAVTLERIAEQGTSGFYAGPVAAAMAASSQAGGGIITQADLADYKTRELEPVQCEYRGLRIVSAPPPSSGGVVICQMLHVLEGYPLKDWGYRSAQAVHVQIEAMRHAYVDRNSALGDPDFVKNPLQRLLSKDYAASIRAVIDPAKAGVSQAIKPGVPPHEGSNTTHYSIIDKAGNAVAVTYTLNDWFGARVTAAGTGVLMNNEMDDFTIKLGVPNLYGLVQGEANAIAPGKRPLELHEPDHRQSRRRQAADGGGHARRQPHHHRRTAQHPERGGLRHEHPGSRGRATFSPAVAARPHQCRALCLEPRHASHPRRHGPQVRRSTTRQSSGRDPRGRTRTRWQGRGQEPLLRRQRSPARNRVGARPLSARARSFERSQRTSGGLRMFLRCRDFIHTTAPCGPALA